MLSPSNFLPPFFLPQITGPGMQGDFLKTSFPLTYKKKACAAPNNAINIISQVKSEILHHPKEAFNLNSNGCLPSPFLPDNK